jgi:sortase A
VASASRTPRTAAIVLMLIGVLCLSWFGFRLAQRARYQREQAAILRTELGHPAAPAGPTAPAPKAAPARAPYHGVVGRLEIPRIHLSAIVVEGDDEATLEKAVGHLPDTALPWEGSNSVLAGHRDGLFRPLRDVRAGDVVRLTTPRGVFSYRVREAFVTGPDNLGVLAPSDDPELTLVTCYPFHYIGAAPKRFIVRAEGVSE